MKPASAQVLLIAPRFVVATLQSGGGARLGDPPPCSILRPARGSARARSGAGPTRAGSASCARRAATRGACDAFSARISRAPCSATAPTSSPSSSEPAASGRGVGRTVGDALSKRRAPATRSRSKVLESSGACSPSSASPRSRATTPTSGERDGSSTRGPFSRSFAPGSTRSAPSCLRRQRSAPGSDISIVSGSASFSFSTTATSRRRITVASASSDDWSSADGTGCSPGSTSAVSEPRTFSRSLRRASHTTSTARLPACGHEAHRPGVAQGQAARALARSHACDPSRDLRRRALGALDVAGRRLARRLTRPLG